MPDIVDSSEASPETPSPEGIADTPTPAVEAPAPAPDPVSTLRSDIADLRAELRTRPVEPPAPRTATTEDVEAAYQSGRITLEQRDAAIEDIKFHQRYETVRARERQQEAETQADAALRDMVRKYPELGQSGSPMLREVEDRLRILSGRGLDPRALGTQLTATEYVVEQRAARSTRHGSPPPVPTSSGPGTFTGGPSSGTQPRDEFADIPQDVRAYWTRTGIAADKWKSHAEAWRATQARRAAKMQAILGRQTG